LKRNWDVNFYTKISNIIKNWKIGTKILIAFTVVAIVAVGLVGFFTFTTGSSTLEDESFNKLTAVREMKASQVEDYFEIIEKQIITLSEDRMIIDAMRRFDGGLHFINQDLELSDEDMQAVDARLRTYYEEEFLPRLIPNLLKDVTVEDYWPKDENTRIMQDLYISSNPFATGSKYILDDPGDGSGYSQTHSLFHPIIRDFQQQFGYYDIFLVDVEAGGHIAYSVFKEVDYATSLLDGPSTDTNFAEAYRAARDADEKDFVAIVDFAPYDPSYHAPASFIASPIFDGDEKIGVLVFQMPIDRINDVMTNNQNWAAVGLGQSGETYIVGEDFTLRNQSRFLIEDSEYYFNLIDEIGIPLSTIARIRNLNSTIGLQVVETDGTLAAQSGSTGEDIFPDYRGVPVLSSYKPLNIQDMDWVIMSEIDQAEAFDPIRDLGIKTGLAVAGLIAAIVVMAVAFSRTITRPLKQLTETANQLAGGNLDVEVQGTEQKDEIGDLASSFDVMRLSMKDMVGELEDINRNLEQKVEERTYELEQSETRTRSIIELASEAIIVSNTDQEVITWNQGAVGIFGYQAEEMIGKQIDLIVPDQYIHLHHDAFGKAKSSGSLSKPGHSHELLGRRKDGSEFPIELSLSQWEIGRNHFFSSIIRDITERKEAEERVRSVIDNAPDAIITIDTEQVIVMFNPSAENIFGYPAEEVIGQPLTTLMPHSATDIHPNYVDNFKDSDELMLSMDNRPGIDGMRKDGSRFPAEASISKMRIGNKLYYTAILRDISERVEAGKQLHLQSSALISAANGIVITSPEGDIEWVNPAYTELTGYSFDESLGKNPRALKSGKHDQAFYQELWTTIKSGQVWQGEIINKKKDGSIYTEEMTITPVLDDDGKIISYVAIKQDITKRKELERQLEIANERMSLELNFAREIQMSMLPLIFPAFPLRKEVTLYATLHPAREVGGDFYDFYFLDDDHMCFVIGDVAGKDAPGALLMAVSKTLIKSRAADDSSPSSILTHVNNELSADNESAMFVTVFLGILNVKTGELVYTNAGHNPPYIKRADGTFQKMDAFHGPVIGAMPDLTYKQDIDILQKDDVILLYTDGVTEALDEDDRLYSDPKLVDLLQDNEFKHPKEMVISIAEDVQSFQGKAEQADDITILAIQYFGLLEETGMNKLELKIKNQLDQLGVVEDEFFEFAMNNEIPAGERQKVSIVLDELLNNVVNYAYDDGELHEIEVEVELSGKRLVITIEDDGVPFNPFGREKPETSSKIEDREIGGLGIHLVRSVMDEYDYQRHIDKNLVRLVKLIDG